MTEYIARLYFGDKRIASIEAAGLGKRAPGFFVKLGNLGFNQKFHCHGSYHPPQPSYGFEGHTIKYTIDPASTVRAAQKIGIKPGDIRQQKNGSTAVFRKMYSEECIRGHVLELLGIRIDLSSESYMSDRLKKSAKSDQKFTHIVCEPTRGHEIVALRIYVTKNMSKSVSVLTRKSGIVRGNGLSFHEFVSVQGFGTYRFFVFMGGVETLSQQERRND